MNTLFASTLHSWYAENHRELPWRNTRDPYRIWISEIILQQTRVAQGYDYFLRFMERFPDVVSLSQASEDEVLLLWQGLGYYSRARNLHKASKVIAANGGFLADYDFIRQLPGVGDYTASAIASFAFNLPHAVLDGNVFRVLSRYFGVDEAIDSTAGKKLFRAMADDMLDTSRPALYNQAIMDFGALVCSPHPHCQTCPLVESCVAFRDSCVDELPVKIHRTKVRTRHLIYILFLCQGKVLLHRRGEGDIWQGLYEPFLCEVKPDEAASAEARLQSLFPSIHLVEQGRRHQLSHQLLISDFYQMDVEDKAQLEEILSQSLPDSYLDKGYEWVPESTLGERATPRLLLEFYKKLNLSD